MRSIIQLPQLNNISLQRLLPILVIVAGMAIALLGSALIGLTGQGILITVGLVGAGAGVLMVLRPAFGVCILVAFVYLNLSDVIEVTFGIPSLNKLLVALIFVGVLGTRAVIQRKPILLRSTEGAILLYGFVMMISTFFSTDPTSAFSEIIDFAKDVAIVLILVQVCDDEHVWKSMQWVVMLSAAFLALLTCYQILTGDTANNFFGLANAPVHEIVVGYDNTRPTGPLEDPNFYSQILLMVFPMLVYRVITETKPAIRILAVVCASLIVLAVIFTYSRSSFLMMMIVVAFIIQERRLNIYKIAIAGIVIVALVSPILPKGFLDRIATLGGTSDLAARGGTEMSFQGRSSEMTVALEMFLDHPILGIGYASFETNYQDYSKKLGMDNRTESREAHSLYLEAAAETGLVGLFTFGLMFFLVFRSMHSARKNLELLNRADLIPWIWGLQFGLMSYLLTSIFLHDGYVRYLRLSIALAVSATAMVDSLVNKRSEEKRKRGYS